MTMSKYVTVYAKTNHMSVKNILRFSTDIGKVPPDGPSLQIWSRLLVACPRYIYFYMRYIPKTAIISRNYVIEMFPSTRSVTRKGPV